MEERVVSGAIFEGHYLFPLHDFVLVVPMNWESKSGLVLPESDQGPSSHGRVVGVGPGRAPDNLEMTVKVGDVVLYGPFPKITFQRGDSKFLLMREQEIVAIIKDVPVEFGAPILN